MADPDDNRGEYRGLFLDPDWPGLDSAKDELYINQDKLKVILGALQDSLDRLEGAEIGSLTNLTKRANLTEMQLGTWDAAKELSRTVERAQEKSAMLYREIIDQYRAVINLIGIAAGTHNTTEIANLTNMKI